jgi:hypothetical protein
LPQVGNGATGGVIVADIVAMEFRAEIRINGVNPYVLVTKRRAQTLKRGWRRPMPVLVQVNGKPDAPWRINMMPNCDGSFHLYLHGDVRKAARAKVGDRVTVRLHFDANYRGGPVHPVPSWFRPALSRHIKVKAAWDALPPSRKKEILRYFSWLKSAETRRRNIARAVAVLSGEKGRFMGRDWENGR